MRKYGVSPAYFISALSDRFTPHEVARTLPDVKALGYDGFQMEIFHPDTLDDWLAGGSARVADRARQHDLQITQFVAHFLLHAFADAASIRSSWGIDECEDIVEMLNAIGESPVVTVPLPAVEADSLHYHALWEALVRKLTNMAGVVHASGRRLAVEIMPGALIGGSDGFLRLQSVLSEAGYEIGYNFDTGHAWAQREPVWLIPAKVGSAISGTHISDNDCSSNDSLRPGAGTVPWETVKRALDSIGYAGSIDLEIKCTPEAVDREYRAALAYMKDLEPIGVE